MIYLLRTGGFRSKLERFINRAVNQASVSIGNLRGIEIEIPSLDEQCRIAGILDQADNLRRKRIAALGRLDDLPQAIFLEMFGNPVTNSKGWATARLRELGQVLTGSTPPSGRDGMFGGNIPFVTPGDLGSGEAVRRTVTPAGASASCNDHCVGSSSIIPAKRLKSPALNVSRRRMPCSSIVATIFVSCT
jgi:type I restriction enzyme S subunit